METIYSLNEINDLDIGLRKDSNAYEFNGKKVPRVTQIISSCIHEDFLMIWANRLGFKHQSYTQVLKGYADYGTMIHEALEKYIKTGVCPPGIPSNPINAFEKWWQQISQNNKIEVLGQEFPLTCQYYGGTYDMLLNINNKPWLVDFKTSNSIKFTYCLQLAAYRDMLKMNKIVNELAGVIVLRLFKDTPKFEEMVIDLSLSDQLVFINDCSKLFNAMVYTYYWRKNLEKRFTGMRRG